MNVQNYPGMIQGRPVIQLPLRPDLVNRLKSEISGLENLIEKEMKYSEDLRKNDLVNWWLEEAAFLGFLINAST